MNREDQARIVRELCDGMRDAILARLDRIPEDWDGIELRLLVAEKATENASFPFATPARRRAFKDESLVLNI